MKHLVEGHLGSYYVSDQDPEIIEEYCSQCGDHDRIIVSWKEGKKLYALLQYFADIKESNDSIIDSYKNGISKEELIDGLMYEYDDDRNLIYNLDNLNIISKEEKLILLKQVSIFQKKQFKLLKEINFDEIEVVKPKAIKYNK